MKKIVSSICIVIGISIIFSPYFKESINENIQSELLEVALDYQESEESNIIISLDDSDYGISLLMEKRILNEKKIRHHFENKVSDEKLVETEIQPDEPSAKEVSFKSAIGTIKINKIDLELPLLKGATKENLNIAPSILRESTDFGVNGNISIAGHRSYTFGKQFNRLDEVEVNDAIEIYFDHRNYTYLVTEKMIVEPEEVWVLESNNDSQMITLITCTPIKVGTHRLIIKGELQSVD